MKRGASTPPKSMETLLKEVSRGLYNDFRAYLNENNITTLGLFLAAYDGWALADTRFFNRLWVALEGTQVTSLDLSKGSITSKRALGEFARALREVPAQITSIDLSYNDIDEQGMKYLATFLPGTNITELNLGGNVLEMGGMKCLAAVLPRTNITHLNVRSNHLNIGGMISLAKKLPQTKITHLDVSSNSLSNDGIKYLAKELPRTNITYLNVSLNHIHTIGAKHLASVLLATDITDLDVSCNTIGDDGMKHLARALLPAATKVKTLNLENSFVFANGAKYLAELLSQTALNSLDIRCNNIGDEGARYFSTALNGSKISRDKLLMGGLCSTHKAREYLSGGECHWNRKKF